MSLGEIGISAWRYLITASIEIFYGLYHRFKEYTKEVLEHLFLAAILYFSICVLLYLGVVKWKIFEFGKSLNGAKRVLLVIAHPDDECMFFGPTILNFTKKNDAVVYLLCLSTGIFFYII